MKTLNEKAKRTYHLKNYQLQALKILSRKTTVKQVEYVREAIDDHILKCREALPENLIEYTRDKDYLEI